MRRGKETPFYQTEEFKRLHALWVKGKNSKLAQAGFEDQEYSNEMLRSKNKRTISYRFQDQLCLKSSAIGFYIEHPSVVLSPLERQILRLHAEGFYNKQIIEITQSNRTTVWKTIKTHVPFALGLYASDEQEAEIDLLLTDIEINPQKERREQ